MQSLLPTLIAMTFFPTSGPETEVIRPRRAKVRLDPRVVEPGDVLELGELRLGPDG